MQWPSLSRACTDLANALAKCLHSPLKGHALQLGCLFVQNTCMKVERKLHSASAKGGEKALI